MSPDKLAIKDEIVFRDILAQVERQMRENNVEGFKATIKFLVNDAIRALEDTQQEWKRKNSSVTLNNKFFLVHHYLEYLKRICEGVA